MNKSLPPHPHRTFSLAPRWRWLSYTVLAVGGGSTTAMVLMQEEAVTLEILGTVVAIPLLGAPILWLVRTLFKQTAPQFDQQSKSDKGHS